jgi:histidinol dehydrogenase
MSINVYQWSSTSAETKQKILKRSETDIHSVRDIVAPIIEDVRVNGDTALVKYAKKFDGADIATTAIKATEEDFARARNNLDDTLKDAIRFCANNVRVFHQTQMDREEKRWLSEVVPGVWAGEQFSPIPSMHFLR